MTEGTTGAQVRRATGAVAIAVLLAGAAWVPGVLPEPSPVPTSSTSSASSGSTATVTAPTAPEIALPESGPGIDEPGTLLVVTTRADGDLQVTELVRWDTPQHEVTLAPPDLGGAGSPLADAEPVATTVQVDAGGSPVLVPEGTVAEETEIALRPTDELTLGYRLEGATARTVPSTTGRALGALRPLARHQAAAPVVVLVTGDHVRNITCPARPPEDRSCGEGTPVRSAGPLPTSQALFALQLDLPVL